MAAATTQEGQVSVRNLAGSDPERWDKYVLGHPEASFFHLSGWREVIERAFGYETWFLLAERKDGICGVLPLARVKSFLFGDAFISTPFCVYGGVIASDAKAREALESEACRFANELGVSYLEMRNRRKVNADWPFTAISMTAPRRRKATRSFSLSSTVAT